MDPKTDKGPNLDNLPDNVERTGVAINNDHALSDVERDSQFAQTSTALAKEKTKRRSKPLLVLLIALIIALLGAVAAIAVYKAYIEKPATPATMSPQPTTTNTASQAKLTAKEVITLVSPSLSGTQNTKSGDQAPILSTPAVKPSGFDFYTATTSAFDKQVVGVQYAIPANQSTVDVAKVGKTLSDKVFTAKQFTLPTTDSSTYTVYSHADVVCGIENNAGSNEAADHTVSVTCYDMANYVALANSLKPFATTYTNSASQNSDTTLLMQGKPTIKASKTTGYHTAFVNISSYTDGQIGTGGFGGMFYQTPDNAWHYFLGTQNAVGCDKYNTPDLKKAYLGETCSDATGKESTVAL